MACKPLRLIHPPSPPPKQQQDAFKVPLVIQLTDDEKFLWRCGTAWGKGSASAAASCQPLPCCCRAGRACCAEGRLPLLGVALAAATALASTARMLLP